MKTVKYLRNLCESRGMVWYNLFASHGKCAATLPSDVEKDSEFVRYYGTDIVHICYDMKINRNGKITGFLKSVKISDAEEMIDALMRRYKLLTKEIRKNKIEAL